MLNFIQLSSNHLEKIASTNSDGSPQPSKELDAARKCVYSWLRQYGDAVRKNA